MLKNEEIKQIIKQGTIKLKELNYQNMTRDKIKFLTPYIMTDLWYYEDYINEHIWKPVYIINKSNHMVDIDIYSKNKKECLGGAYNVYPECLIPYTKEAFEYFGKLFHDKKNKSNNYPSYWEELNYES